jgi:hypothetical protein
VDGGCDWPRRYYFLARFETDFRMRVIPFLKSMGVIFVTHSNAPFVFGVIRYIEKDRSMHIGMFNVASVIVHQRPHHILHLALTIHNLNLLSVIAALL